ncbi:MAG: AAA family ATPase [Oscillospiraceae bacterium]|nr:AAA family ATPase [Oscillospiraceae bacterium]
MRRIICIIGKSGAGKDTALAELLKRNKQDIRPVVTYTTRPRRSSEADGREYYFVDDEVFAKLKEQNKIIESRTYHTFKGDWTYFTCESCFTDGQYNVMIATPEAVDKLCGYFGEEEIHVIFLTLDNKKRLLRCIDREEAQAKPDYSEVCRRYLADDRDFADEQINKYKNIYRVDTDDDISNIADKILDVIKSIG